MNKTTAFTAQDFIKAYMGDYIDQILPEGTQTSIKQAWDNINQYQSVRNAFEETGSTDNDLLAIGETIKNWSEITYASNIDIISNQNPYNF